MIGNYLILEIVDFSKIKDYDTIKSNFENRHKTVKEEWNKKDDFVHASFFIDKMEYSKNCAPFSIYPFDIGTCTDIMMGRLMINVNFNFTAILRHIRKAGWNIEDALIYKSEDEIKALQGKDIEDASFLKIRKGSLSIDVPPSLIARMQYELVAPSTIIAEFEEIFQRKPKDYSYSLTNYTQEKNVWN